MKHLHMAWRGAAASFLWLATLAAPAKSGAQNWEITPDAPDPIMGLALGGSGATAAIIVDPGDYPVVKLAAGLLGGDIERVTGKHPEVRDNAAGSPLAIIVGTLGHSVWIDQLAGAGKLGNLEGLRGHWETTFSQMVDHPFPGMERAFVIAGSDRRGAAYGVMDLCEKIGVSPWNWWADVPAPRQGSLSIRSPRPGLQAPAVKYRGIFLNDEDSGLNPWAGKTFDPAFGNIGPRTYEKIFELMLRLKLNYLWPAMHPCSTEFGSVPENSALADRYAIVMGASHCEQMLRNNIWYPKDKGPWNYGTNRENIYAYWEEGARTRGQYEAVWTLGLRGVHDAPMAGADDLPGKKMILKQAITDQRELLERHVGGAWGPVAQCFIPYKEVQPIYDAGLEVPPDVTLVWADDNFGYLRRLSSPAERARPGGGGFYYHISYLGSPHAYTWLNTTPPALMWEEMRKAWDNDNRTIWIVNVGDIKPAEVGIDFFARLAWNAPAAGPDAQPRFLHDFASRTFGGEYADAIARFETEFFRLGQIRKPECMNTAWAAKLPPEDAAELAGGYQRLLEREKALAARLPREFRDAWTEMMGYPARMLGASGLIFLENRLAKQSGDRASHEAAVNRWHVFIENETDAYNNRVAGGKWRNMMALGDLSGGWASYSRIDWPWRDGPKGESAPVLYTTDPARPLPVILKRKAGDFNRKSGEARARWAVIDGLGHSAKAVALEPASVENAWDPAANGSTAPSLEYDFVSKGGSEAVIYLLPTFRLYPGRKLRIAVGVDDAEPEIWEVPGSSGSEDENGRVRASAVLDNQVSLHVALPQLAPGKHTLKIRAIDPGAVVDEIAFP